MAKDRYEISLWEDFEVPAAGNIPAYYDERKVAVIGSDTMTAPCRALEPKLVENINGTNTFTFKMLYLYDITDIEEARARGTIENDLTWVKDDKEENCYRNPFQSLLVNERKVKVHWKDKWYDLVIKNIQEDSSGRSVTYTCKDLFVNELSKTGFDLVFDNELENNQGTAPELVEKVLEGSDWRLARDSDIIQQEKEEPVYAVTLVNGLTNVKNQTTGATSITISSGKTILIYYQQVQDFITSGVSPSSVQFAYVDGEYKRDNNSQLVINADCYIKDNVTFTLNGDTVTISSVGSFNRTNISENYRASRLVESPLCKLDPLTGEYCYVYKANANGTGYAKNDEIYEYRATNYKDATFVNDLIVNGKGFVNTEGWYTPNSSNVPVQELYPPYDGTISWTPTALLKLTANATYTNYGIRQNSNFVPNGFRVGEKYILRAKARTNGSKGTYNKSVTYTPQIKDNKNALYFSVGTVSTDGNWRQYILTCTKSITRAEIYSKELVLNITPNTTVYLEEIQFFPLVFGSNNQRIEPGQYDIDSVAQVYHYYYNHTKSQGLINADDIKYLQVSTSAWNDSGKLVAQKNPDFVKIRTINAKQSNRFNILQSIAETFECWIKFTISHDSNGKITYIGGKAQKYVSIKKDIGQETGIGFIYGIDLKTISRSIKSDQIVTKTIVPQNSNEFGKNGFCTIARSEQNYPRTNFVLNFDYYITQGLINSGKLNKDLYLSVQYPDNNSEKVDAYYFSLNKWNTEYDSNIEWISNKKTELDKQKSFLTVYQDTLIALKQQKTSIESELIGIAGATSWEKAQQYLKKNQNRDEIKSRQAARSSVNTQISLYQGYISSLTKSIEKLEKSITQKEDRQKKLIQYIKNKHLAFYKKYSRFLQEGTWTDESYIDDNLFYLDAQSVAYTSSRPQVEYNISVIRLSALEEYKNKVFKLGDIGFIQDTEFFGYENIGGVRTPYKEMILVSEITSFLDEPEKDSFKIQNYKTQFEDLFQRITSTTQSLQYASGSYAKVASTITEEGDIKPETLQSSIAINEQLVISAKNETVYSDGTGLTVADTTNPNNKTKMTSGGVFITSDGGVTWKSAIRSGGVSTENLAAGAISTGTINVIDGNHATFRWDAQGINSFYYDNNGINTSRFVRFDHYGIYGINGNADFDPDTISNDITGEEKIWNEGRFGLTWHGFFLKNVDKNGNTEVGSVEITSDDDIRVLAHNGTESTERIKIGRLYANGEIGYEETNQYVAGQHYYIKNGPWYDQADLTIWKDINYYTLSYNLVNLFTEVNLESFTDEVNFDYRDISNTIFYNLTASTQFLINTTYYIYNGTNYVVVEPGTVFDPNETYYVYGPLNVDTPYYKLGENNTYVEVELEEKLNPDPSTTYYIYGVEGGGGFGDRDYYTSDGSNYVLVLDEYPTPNVTYFIYNAAFESGIDYYEYINEQYVLTSDTVPIYGKTYYNFTPNPQTTYYYKDSNGDFQPYESQAPININVNNYTRTVNEVIKSEVKQPLRDVQYYISTGDNSYREATDADFDSGFVSGVTYYKKNENTTYGIRISDASGAPVMETISDGTLWLKKALYIQSTDNPNTGEDLYSIALGFLDLINFPGIVQNITPDNYQLWPEGTTKDADVQYYNYDSETERYIPVSDTSGNYYIQITQEMCEKGLYKRLANDEQAIPIPVTSEEIAALKQYLYFYRASLHQIFNSNNNFIVYEDGSIIANNGTFSGTIYASSGTFSGQLIAATGSFDGQITAKEGYIGGGYVPYSPQPTEYFDDNKHYYELDPISGTYFETEDTVPNPQKIYYQMLPGVEITKEGLRAVDGSSITIEGGYFQIFDSTGKKVLYLDETTDVLTAIGHIEAESGIFNGTIYAESGEFNGTINAKSGIIGGFKIFNNQLASTEKILSDGYPFEEAVITDDEFQPGINYYKIVDDKYQLLTPEEIAAGPQEGVTYYNFVSGLYILKNGVYEEVKPDTDLTNIQDFYIEGQAIQLNGQDGSIIADNITLGTGARISEYLYLGEHVKLYNADINNGKYLVVTESVDNEEIEKIIFRNDATIILGRNEVNGIYLNGRNGSISGGDFSTQNYFNITPEQASFKNIVASGKISTVVFEQNHVQAVGGSMIFKPSFKVEGYSDEIIQIDSVNYYKLILDTDVSEFINDTFSSQFVHLVYENGSLGDGVPVSIKRPSDANLNNNEVLIASDNIVLNGLVSIVLLGQYNDILIGVNTNENSSFMRARGITIAEFDSELRYPTKAFLGDLDNLDKEFTLLPDGAGYGLYTENAFLNGSLTTRVRRRDIPAIISYAGVNTLNGTNATKFDGSHKEQVDTSSIVFWAGSPGITDADIQQSPFQVTENGSLYASQGVFEGAIITRSEIRGADIYAARIHGVGREESSQNNYGLAFYNMTNGIVFKTGDDDTTATDVFRIGEFGLFLLKESEQKYFIRVNQNNIYYNGFYYVSEGLSSEVDASVLRRDGLYWHPNKTNLSLDDNDDPVYYDLNFTIESNEVTSSFRDGTKKAFEINYTNGSINNLLELTYVSKTLNLGHKVEYRQASNGYDLYVS